MPGILRTGVIVGLLAGLIVGGFHNLFTIPVIEDAIAFEEQRALQEPAAPGESDGGEVSLGVQRVGTAVGMGIFGVILGAVFSGLYALVRRVLPGRGALAVALVSAGLGFWAISLFPFVKYPMNPPGVGESDTLVYRQGFQVLFFLLSMGAVVALLLLVDQANRTAKLLSQKRSAFAGLAVLYGAFAAVLYFTLPSNPDPVTAPSDLVWRFRALSMVGHLLLWGILALGVSLALNIRRSPLRVGA